MQKMAELILAGGTQNQNVTYRFGLLTVDSLKKAENG